VKKAWSKFEDKVKKSLPVTVKMMKTFISLLALTLALREVSAFLIIDAEPGVVIKAPGELVTLFCAVDDDYEYCKFISPDSEKICDFEWKRNEGNITMQQCDLDVFKKNVSFHGKYNDKECGMSFIAGEEDTGTWKCEIEEYVWGGSRGSGRKVWAAMNVTVMSPTTTASPTSVTTTSASTPVATRTTSSATSTGSSTAMIDGGGLTTLPTAKAAEKDIIPDAVPRTQGDGAETAGSMTSTIIAILAIIVITVCLGLAAAYYRRKQRQKRPDADAAVVYDAESRLNKDTANMVRTRGSVSLTSSEEPDNRNLHEFFPSSDSFA